MKRAMTGDEALRALERELEKIVNDLFGTRKPQTECYHAVNNVLYAVRAALNAGPQTPGAEGDTNRDKALRGEPVQITIPRLVQMRDQAIKFEGFRDTEYHWHWAAAINELIALRAMPQDPQGGVR